MRSNCSVKKMIKGGNANANAASNSASNARSGIMDGNLPVIIAIGIVILAFVAVIIYISFVLKASNLKGKRLTIEPIKLDELKKAQVIDAIEIPKPVVGREYSYSFWVYIDSFSQTVNNRPQMMFYRGSQTTLADANPIVMLDGTSNKLYMVLKTQGSSLSATNNSNSADVNLKNIIERSYFLNKDTRLDTPDVNKHIIVSIDYVPLQRWVNIAFVVDNKIITTFLDGEIYSVKSVDEYKTLKSPEMDARGNVRDYPLVIEPTTGSIQLGKFGDSEVASSYVSNLEFFNYAVSLNDIKSIYKMGPFARSWLSLLGINAYGIRSPIYPLYEKQ